MTSNQDIVSVGFNVNCYDFKTFPSPRKGNSRGYYWLLLWTPSQTSFPWLSFSSFQNMLEIISKHASDACIFSFTYNLIPGILPRYLTSYQSHQDRVCFLTTSPLQLRTVTTRLRRLRPASLTPKEVRNSQLFPPPRGLAENLTPCVSRLWLQL